MTSQSSFAIELPHGLLTGIRRGDIGAFETLFRLFERPVYGLAVRMLGEPDLAMETMHDTFLKASEGINGFRGESPFWGWLRQIAVNESLIRLRRRRSVPGQDELPDIAASGGDADPIRQAEAGLLDAAMARLPAVTRSVLWLFHVEGYTHEEIARMMDKSTSFSKSQLMRGTQKLRCLLQAQPETVDGQ